MHPHHATAPSTPVNAKFDVDGLVQVAGPLLPEPDERGSAPLHGSASQGGVIVNPVTCFVFATQCWTNSRSPLTPIMRFLLSNADLLQQHVHLTKGVLLPLV
jgi:hypothetical protein